MEFHEVKQRLFADGALEDIKVIHEEFSGLDQEPAARWDTLRQAFESNGMARQWSPWAAYVVACLDALSTDERQYAIEHHEALLDAVTAQVLAAHQEEVPRHQAEPDAEMAEAPPAAPTPPFSPKRLWSALSAEMKRREDRGEVPAIPGSAHAVGRRLVEVAWNAALGQHTPADAADVWIHECLHTAQRNVGIDLSQPQAVKVLRADRRAFFALREAMKSTAEGLVAAARRKAADAVKKSRKADAAREPDDDPFDGESLRILFGEVEMQTILDDEGLTGVLAGLVEDGHMRVKFEETNEPPPQSRA